MSLVLNMLNTCLKKQQEQSHLKPLFEIFSSDQLDKVPIDNKVGENYFGEFTEQLSLIQRHRRAPCTEL